jgi:hypothetical protein
MSRISSINSLGADACDLNTSNTPPMVVAGKMVTPSTSP